MKNDQTGDQKRDPRHIYADPIDPTVYPILALAIYFSTFSISNTKDTALFPGKNQCRQFSKYFELILNQYKDEIKSDFGVAAKDLGVTSLQKGTASYVYSGSTCGPHLKQQQISEQDG